MEDALNSPSLSIRNTAKIYIYDVLWNCSTIKREYKKIEDMSHALTGKDKNEGFVFNNDDMQRSAISIVMCAASISKLIKPNTSRIKGETNSAHAFRQSRFRFFQSILGSENIVEMYNTSLRNSLEHFDEHLDALTRSAMRLETKGQKYRLYNIGLTRESMLSVEGGITHLRTYLVEDKVLILFDKKINIGKIVQEAQIIASRIADEYGLEQEMGGVFIQGRD